jgi:hypothetical protein
MLWKLMTNVKKKGFCEDSKVFGFMSQSTLKVDSIVCDCLNLQWIKMITINTRIKVQTKLGLFQSSNDGMWHIWAV